jgi:hypothetical protein
MHVFEHHIQIFKAVSAQCCQQAKCCPPRIYVLALWSRVKPLVTLGDFEQALMYQVMGELVADFKFVLRKLLQQPRKHLHLALQISVLIGSRLLLCFPLDDLLS